MSITETCSCGATVTITDSSASMAGLMAERWRRGHRHAEGVGICGDKAPLIVPEGSDMPAMFCDLKAGHAGAHSDGTGHWATTPTHRAPSETEAEEAADG